MLDLIYDELYEKNLKNATDRVMEAYNFSQHLGLGKLYVAFSGGKDSVCLYGVCKKVAEKLGKDVLDICEFHYNITCVDPPELVNFIKKEFPFVERHRPEKTMWQLIVEHSMPPTRIVRYCCTQLKERGGLGRFCVTGVRWAESSRRKTRGAFEDNEEDRRQLEHCIPKNKYVCNPIIDWSDDMVWNFIHSENLPYCKLYDEGFNRIGCIGCPMARRKNQLAEFKRWPKFYEQYIRTFDRMLEKRRGKGLPTRWKTGQEVMNWWLGFDDENDTTSLSEFWEEVLAENKEK